MPAADPVRLSGVRALGVGARVGLAFGSVEALSMSFATWLVRPGFAYQAQHAFAEVGALLLHAGAGAVLGLFAHACGRRTAADVVRVATAGFVLALAVSLATSGALDARSLQLVALGNALFAAALFATLARRADGSRRVRLGELERPWCAAALSLLPAWATQVAVPADAHGAKLVVLGACGAAALGVAARSRSAERARAPSAIALASGVLAVVAAGLFCRPSVFRASPAVGAKSPASAARTNVLLVVLDTVRADHCSLYGYSRETTPSLAAFARDAWVFERAYATSAVTLASHASLFTGLQPSEHGAQADERSPDGRPLGPGPTTLAESLGALGYDTAALVANHGFLSPVFGLQRGFAHYDARPPVPELAPTPPWVLRRRWRALAERIAPRAWSDRGYRRADEIVDATLAWLERRNAQRPFFAFVNLMDAHAPCLPPAPFDTRFAARAPSLTRRDHYAWRDAVNSGRSELDPEVRRELVDRYDGGIAFADHELARLFDGLRRSGELERTLVVVTSDHGEGFGEHGQLFHNATVYEEEVHVPLVIRMPGAPAGRRVTELASGIDVLPTVREALGLDARAELAGRCLLRTPREEACALVENRPVAGVRALALERLPDQIGLVRGTHSWIEPRNGAPQLFDLEHDPGQRDDRAHLDVELARNLAGELARRRAAFSLPRDAADGDSSAPARDALRQLGYAR